MKKAGDLTRQTHQAVAEAPFGTRQFVTPRSADERVSRQQGARRHPTQTAAADESKMRRIRESPRRKP